MKFENLFNALNHISDKHIAQGDAPKKPRGKWLLRVGAVAAAAAILFTVLRLPAPIFATEVASASGSRIAVRPDIDDYDGQDEQWRAALAQWETERAVLQDTLAEAADPLRTFSLLGGQKFLSGDDGNRVWSPLNAYIGLAMVAELSDGDSRQQILELLGTEDLDTLRSHISAVWEAVYEDDGHEISVLANSLWLNKDLQFHQETMDSIAYHHHADIYQADFTKKSTASAIQAWLNNNTGGLLKKQIQNLLLPENMVMGIYSTIYFQAKWSQQFSEERNTQELFHSPAGDVTRTFMNAQRQTQYYWAEDFGAIALGLKNGSRLWLFLPDEDKTPQDVVSSEDYLHILSNQWENHKYMKVNLSLPKFDVVCQQNLQEGLAELGVTDVFDPEAADFSAALDGGPVWLTAANQAARVMIDEEGVKAAAYIEFPAAGAPAPPEEIIDFVLDRPFVFVITSDSLPLFAGVVNNP